MKQQDGPADQMDLYHQPATSAHFDVTSLVDNGYSDSDSASDNVETASLYSQSEDDQIVDNVHRLNSAVNCYFEGDLTLWHGWLHRLKDLHARLGLKHGIPVLLLALYSLVGAGAFYSLESANETRVLAANRKVLDEARRQMAERVWELKLENLTRRKVLRYALDAVKWYDEVTATLEVNERQWDFWGAVFYCGTVYTTIGYGNIVPRTFGGKLLTLFYAAFGIPLVFFILNDLGDVLAKSIYRMWTKVRKCFQCKKRLRAQSQDDVSVRSIASTTAEFVSVHDLPMSVALGITLGWIFLCSAIFCGWEDWDYFQAFHFFFVSLTTIGLGDTVPHHRNYMIMSFGLILLGLSLVSMCIQVVQAKVEHLAQQILEKLMKRYQVPEGLDGDIRATDLIERTLDQEMAPSWIRALLTKRTKAKLVKAMRKRAKVRVAGTQTDCHRARKVHAMGCQTVLEPDWKVAYEKKLATARDLLKELELRYAAVVRDQQRNKRRDQGPKWGKASLKKSRRLANPSMADIQLEKPGAKKHQRIFGKFQSDNKKFILSSPVVSSAGCGTLLMRKHPTNQKQIQSCQLRNHYEHSPFVGPGRRQPGLKDAIVNVDLLSSMPQSTTIDYNPSTSPKHKTTVAVEEYIDESKFENRSAITRWIRRLLPMSPVKKAVSRKSQTIDDYTNANTVGVDRDNLVCPVCQSSSARLTSSDTEMKSHSSPTITTQAIMNEENTSPIISLERDTSTGLSDIAVPTPTVASADTQTSDGVMMETRSDIVMSARTNAAVQCSGLLRSGFITVPYVLDDCKLLFGAIQKRLAECQSILGDPLERRVANQ